MSSPHEAEPANRRLVHPPPGGWRVATVEVVLLAAVLLAFTRLHDAAGTDVEAATANALSLQSVEQALHLNIELSANRWLAQHDGLILPAVLLYRLYYLAPIGALLWSFFGRPPVYLHARRTFVAMIALALLVFWALPMSPPRFALPGVHDIIADHDILGSHASRDLSSGANLFSAMPSLHVGWSAWSAYTVWLMLRRSHPRAALLAWLFPLLMVADVLATGAHYVLDVVGSAVLLGAAIALATGWRRLWRTRVSAGGQGATRHPPFGAV